MIPLTRPRLLLLIIAATLLFGAAIPAAAGAAPFGEISRFGSAGIGNGQFSEAGTETIAFGVDSGDESVYVGDKPSAKVFRIQKFSASGTYIASANIKALPGEGAIEGVAVDSTAHRLYVLVVLTRGEAELGESAAAAAEVYAFSTEAVGGKLEPASGTVEEGVLVGKSTLKPSSNTPGQPLLEPSGLTVDPVKHDIILMGLEEKTAEEPRVALERFTENGALAEPRWVDSEGSPYFEVQNDAGSSPVVTSSGHVYVVGEALGKSGSQTEQIVEIPAEFKTHAAAKPYIEYEPGELDLVTFPGEPHPLEGGGLSLAPDGTLWTFAKILSPGVGRLPGALAFSTSGASPAVRGWTGGQTIKIGTGECVISFTGHPMVAAGKEDVFMFDSDPVSPRVVRFGPGGKGCPTAQAGPLEAFVGAKKEESSDLIAPNSEVSLSTTLAGANALNVKWNFGDGSGEVTTSNQHQAPSVLHKYTSEGTFKVVATIASDNLATPTLVLERTLTVSKPIPVAKFSTLSELTVGQSDTFDAKGSSGAEGAAISEYKWDFGDGSVATTTTPTTTHAFATPGRYTVTLQVVDANKLVSKVASASVLVNAVIVTPPPPTTTGSTPPPPPSNGGVLPFKIAVPPSALTASSGGVLTLKIDCAGQSACTGTATLKTASAVSAGKHKKKAVLTLASGSFKVLGGHVQAITLHLSAAARTLLARSGSHGLRVRVSILARDSAGVAHPMQAVLTIHAAKAKKHH